MKPSNPNNPQEKITLTQQQFYSGPVPDPESLAKYESITPGFADRLLKMGEKEQEERINTQNKVIASIATVFIAGRLLLLRKKIADKDKRE